MNDVDDLLRRDGEHWRTTATAIPRVDWAALPGRRRRRAFASSWWMVPIAGATAAVVVVLAVAGPSWIGRGSTAHKPLPAPAHRPSRAPTTGPASFIALNNTGYVTLVNARTGESYGGSVSEDGRTPTALGVADSGTLAYATFSHPHCQIEVDRYRWKSPYTSEGTGAATVAGTRADGIAVSPDGYVLALAVQPCGQMATANVEDVVVVDLRTHQQRRFAGLTYRVLPIKLALGPDDRTLVYNVVACCNQPGESPQILDTGNDLSSPLALPSNFIPFWYRGQLASLIDSETVPGQYDIRAMSTTGDLGPILAKGLPQDVVTVTPDRTGAHLLLTTDTGKLLRWDDGVLTALPGGWVDAGW